MSQCFRLVHAILEKMTIFSFVPTQCFSPFQSHKDLYQFLYVHQQQAIDKNADQIVSIALEVDRVDPLAVLQELSTPNQPHFYLEKGFEDESIAAIGAVASLEVEGRDRFAKVQAFISEFTSSFEDLTLATQWGSPRFFCSFTFFEQSDSWFPSATVFLPQWQVIRRQQRSVVIANLRVGDRSNLTALTDQLWQQFQTIRLAKYGVFNLPDSLRQTMNQWEVINTNSFQSAVNSALRLIAKNQLNKLVVAHAIDVVSRFPFQHIQSLHHLRQRHPDSYVFSTSSGRGRSFMGASPERLIRIQERLFVTDALAGSAARGRSPDEDADLAKGLINSEKEQREHQVVVDFICQSLAKFGLVPAFAAPTLLKLPNIQHLHTPIQADLPRELQPLELLAELHPTPAVAGMPRSIACDQIRAHESFERSLYAAPLGWIDGQGNAEFIVGIRSAMIAGCHARLYAGAGIVAGSKPDRELAEVKLKLQVLLQSLV